MALRRLQGSTFHKTKMVKETKDGCGSKVKKKKSEEEERSN